jgi:hypothetical protein
MDSWWVWVSAKVLLNQNYITTFVTKAWFWWLIQEVRVVGYKQASTSDFEMKDPSMMHYFLGQEVWQRTIKNFPKSKKIYSGDIKEVQHDRMQIHVYTDGDWFDKK